MPDYTVSAAARLCGVDRRTIHRAIQAGRLHLDAQHCVSREALIAAGYHPAAPQGHAAPMPQRTPHEETPDAAGLLTREAFTMTGYHPAAPQETIQDAADMPQELLMATALLAHLEDLTSTIAALHQEVVLLREDLRQTPQRRPRIPWGTPQIDAAPVPHHDALLPRGIQEDAAGAPQVDAAPTPQDMRHAAGAPHYDPATPETPATLPAYVQRIAEVAAEYDKLTLGQLAQLLYDRNIYRARDRKSGEEKPVNRGTLTRWLEQAREAGVL